jgi:hypothetical protein
VSLVQLDAVCCSLVQYSSMALQHEDQVAAMLWTVANGQNSQL